MSIKKLSATKALIIGHPGKGLWEVKYRLTYPLVHARCGREESRSNCGGYTTQELVAPCHYLDQWFEHGYKFVQATNEEPGVIEITLKQGPINVYITLTVVSREE